MINDIILNIQAFITEHGFMFGFVCIFFFLLSIIINMILGDAIKKLYEKIKEYFGVTKKESFMFLVALFVLAGILFITHNIDANPPIEYNFSSPPKSNNIVDDYYCINCDCNYDKECFIYRDLVVLQININDLVNVTTYCKAGVNNPINQGARIYQYFVKNRVPLRVINIDNEIGEVLLCSCHIMASCFDTWVSIYTLEIISQ